MFHASSSAPHGFNGSDILSMAVIEEPRKIGGTYYIWPGPIFQAYFPGDMPPKYGQTYVLSS